MKDDNEIDEDVKTSDQLATNNYLTGLEEREKLKKELDNTKKELTSAKSQNYDLLKRIEELQEQMKSKKEELHNERKKSRPSTAGRGSRRPVKRKEQRKNKKINENGAKEMTPENVFETTENLYEFLAEKFPNMPLSTILKAQKKFTETDIDGNGTVDATELETMLDTSNLLFTKQQVEDILKTIDEDNTNSLDFIECLTVLDQLRSNRKTKLPQSLQQQRSTICEIQ